MAGLRSTTDNKKKHGGDITTAQIITIAETCTRHEETLNIWLWNECGRYLYVCTVKLLIIASLIEDDTILQR